MRLIPQPLDLRTLHITHEALGVRPKRREGRGLGRTAVCVMKDTELEKL